MTSGSLLATIVSAVSVAVSGSALLGVIVGFVLGISLVCAKGGKR